MIVLDGRKSGNIKCRWVLKKHKEGKKKLSLEFPAYMWINNKSIELIITSHGGRWEIR